MLTSRGKLEARIKDLEQKITDLETINAADMEAKDTQISELQTQLAASSEEKESIQDQLNEANQKITDAEKAHEDKISDLEGQIETIKADIDKQVATKAAAIVAELGIAPVGVKASDKPNTPDVSNLKGLDRAIHALKQKNAQS